MSAEARPAFVLDFEDDGEDGRRQLRARQRLAEACVKASAGFGHRLVPRQEVRRAVAEAAKA